MRARRRKGRGRRGRPWLVDVGGAMVALFALVAVFAPLIARHDPGAFFDQALQSPSSAHPLGTDDLGRDIFSQLVWGTRYSLGMGIGAAAVTTVVALVVAAAGVFTRGIGERLLNQTIHVFLSLPTLPLLILIAALARSNPLVVVLSIGLVGWPFFARIFRSRMLSLRQRGYVKAAQGFGAAPRYLTWRHVVPAIGPLVTTAFATMVGISIFLESALAYLGLGNPSGASWGNVLNRALRYGDLYFSSLWAWWVLPAGMAITLAVLGFTFLSMGLDPRWNPRKEKVVA